MKLETKTKIIILVVPILTLALFVASLTYAYFTAPVKGNETASTTNIKVGILDLEFDTSAYIQNTKASLINDDDRSTKADKSTFSIKHTASSKSTAYYNLYLTDLTISDNLKSKDFKWELLINNKVVASGNFLNATTGSNMPLTTSTITLATGNVDNGELRIWLSNTDVDQSSLYSGSFQAKIALDART